MRPMKDEARQEFAERIGENIRARREAAELPRHLLAAMAGLNEEALRQMELGERSPSSFVLARLAANLGVTADDLLPSGYREQYGAARSLRVVAERLEQLGRLPVAAGERPAKRAATTSRRSSAASRKRGKNTEGRAFREEFASISSLPNRYSGATESSEEPEAA